MCTVVYAYNEEDNRKVLWEYIITQSKNNNLPWILVGDFNTIFYNSERVNNGRFNSIGDQKFIECINLLKLVEPDYSCNFFTWRPSIC